MTPKQVNKIISKWMYPSARKTQSSFGIEHYEYQDVNGPESWRWMPCPDFAADPVAWDADLYNKIDSTGLYVPFTSLLKEMTVGTPIASLTARHAMRLLRATPEQKAIALAKAIQEAG